MDYHKIVSESFWREGAERIGIQITAFKKYAYMREILSYTCKSKEDKRFGRKRKERNLTSELSIIKCKTYKNQHEIMRVDLVKEGLGQGKDLYRGLIYQSHKLSE